MSSDRRKERSLERAGSLSRDAAMAVVEELVSLVPGAGLPFQLSRAVLRWELARRGERLHRLAEYLLDQHDDDQQATVNELNGLDADLWPFILEKVQEDSERDKATAYAMLCRWLAREKLDPEVARAIVRTVATLELHDLRLLRHLGELPPAIGAPTVQAVSESDWRLPETIYALRLERLASTGCLGPESRTGPPSLFHHNPCSELGRLVAAAVGDLEPRAPELTGDYSLRP